MKKIKKALICVAACATALSTAALAACADNAPSDGLSSDVTVTSQLSRQELNSHVEKFNNPTATSFTLNGSVTMIKSGETTVNEKLATVSVKANLAGGNADAELVADAEFVQGIIGSIGGGNSGNDTPQISQNGGVSAQADEAAGDTAGTTVGMNVYLRNWKAFYPDTEGVGEGDFNYFDVAKALSGDANITTGELVTLLGAGLAQDNAMLLKLANSTDSITVDETAHTISLDINKMVYGVYGYIKQIVNNVTADTTVSGILKCSAVKFYMNAVLGDTTAAELYQTLMAAITSGGNIGGGTSLVALAGATEQNPFAVIQPNEGEKAYDYILRILNSQDFATAMGMEKPIGATKIVDMLGADAETALNSLKGMVAMVEQMNIVTATSVNIPSEGGMEPALAGTSVSNLKVIYTFSEQNVLQSVDFSGNIAMSGNEMKVELGVEFSSEAITGFEDLSNSTANVYNEETGAYEVKSVNELINPAPQA